MAEPNADWDPRQYERFKSERAQPFFDLLALVRPRAGMRIVDLGCGTGELTRELHARLQASETLGLDSSPAMLARAAKVAVPGLSFACHDLGAQPAGGPWDLVFSNAALHWIEDHERLLERLRAMLAPGGQLAVQVPASHHMATHTTAAEVAREAPFEGELGGWVRTSPVLTPARYAERLAELGFGEQHVRLQVYLHRLAERGEVVEWVKGTLLTAYARRLSPASFDRFLARYREVLLPRLRDTRPFLLPFERILLWASVDR